MSSTLEDLRLPAAAAKKIDIGGTGSGEEDWQRRARERVVRPAQ